MRHTTKKNAPMLSVVIPVYNEPDNILITLKNVAKHITVPHEVLVVYDSSYDTTLPVLEQIKRTNKNLHLLKNSVAPGPSGALRTGFMHARAPKILVTMADLCDDLRQVMVMIKKKADIVSPSRYSKGGRQELKSSPFKIMIPRTAGLLLHLLAGIPTKDPTNSYKMYSRSMLCTMELTSTVSFSVTLEIIAKAHIAAFRIVEIPTVWRDRQHGKTNFNLGSSLVPYLRWFILALRRNRLFIL